MAEDDGSARIRIILDSTGVPAEARALGTRIKAAINSGMRGLDRDIQQAIAKTTVQVRVVPDLTRFETRLRSGLRNLPAVPVSVTPDLSRFESRLRAGLRGLDDASIRVIPELGRFEAQLRAGLRGIDAVSVPVVPDLSRFRTALASGLRGLPDAAVRVAPDLTRFQMQLRAGLRGLPDAAVRVAPDLTRFQSQLRAGLRGLPDAVVRVAPDLTRFQSQLRAGLRSLPDAAVRVVPDLTRFEAQLRAGLRGLPDAAVRVVPDISRFQSGLRTALRGLSAQVVVTPDLRGFNRALQTEIRTRLDGVRIPIIPDLRRFDRSLVQGLSDLEGIRVPVIPDLRRFEARLRTALRGVEISIPVVPDMSGFNARIRAHPLPTVTVPTNADTNGFRKALSKLGQVAGVAAKSLTGLLAFGAIGIAAASAATNVGALLAALAPAGGIIAAFPAVIAGAVVALGTLKLAFLGVGDALSAALSGDADQFAEALKKLSPAAQKAVLAVRSFAPELKKVQQSVQQSFFKQFSGDITGALKNLLPLGSGLKKVSAQFGKAASEGLKFAATSQASAPLKAIIQGTADAASGLQTAIAPIAKGFLDIGAAISTAFGAKAGAAIGDLGARFGTYLSGLAASGRAVELVSAAVKVFKQLGSIVSNVGGIISGVFKAADDAGGGLLNNLSTITGHFEKFVKSAEGAESLRGVFGAVAEVAAQLGPILTAVVTQLGKLGPTLVPVITQLGQAITVLVGGLDLRGLAAGLSSVAGGLVEGFQYIAPALAPVATALGSLLDAVSPLLPVVGQLVGLVATGLAYAVRAASPLIKVLASWLAVALGGALAIAQGALRVFLGVARQVWRVVEPLADLVGGALAAGFRKLTESGIVSGAFDKLIDVLRVFKPFFDEVAPAAARLATSLKDLASDVYARLVPALQGLKREVVPALAPLRRLGGDVMRNLGAASRKAGRDVAALLDHMAPLARETLRTLKPAADLALAFLRMHVLNGLPEKIERLATVLAMFGYAVKEGLRGLYEFVHDAIDLFQFLYDVLVGHSIVPDLITAIISWFAQLPNQVVAIVSQLVTGLISWFAALPTRIMEALSTLGVSLGTIFATAFTAAWINIQAWGASLNAWFAGLPARIWTALLSLGSFLVSAFTSAGQQAMSVARGWGASAVAWFATIPPAIGGALSSLAGWVSNQFRLAAAAARSLALQARSQVVAAFRSLPSMVGSALGPLGSHLSGALNSALGAALGAVDRIMSSIASRFAGLGSLISASIGNIGGQILGQIKSGLPASVRGLLPFANGGIVDGPTAALIGEAGREVVIPLTRPQRARQLAEQSGLLGILGTAKRTPAPAGSGRSVTNNFTIHEAGDGHVTAHRVISRMALAAGI